MANGTIAFDTLQTSGQITGTAKSVDTDFIVNGSAKSWVNFDGTGTPSINDSFNASSLNDNNTAEVSVNFSSNMNNANYATSGAGSKDNVIVTTSRGTSNSTSVLTTFVVNLSGTATEVDTVNALAHGEIA
tara:strand:+ start:312 stop:704 length:393 start_codon:yes stop_codon:yes gene_type:complete